MKIKHRPKAKKLLNMQPPKGSRFQTRYKAGFEEKIEGFRGFEKNLGY
jgi:hypothetical protein